MYKHFLTLIVASLLSWSLAAQCPESEVVLPSQAAVDFYVQTFPNCASVERLQIGETGITNDITDISGLASITNVETDLAIINTNLTALTGLNNITNIGGNLLVRNNANLTSIQALSNVASINGFLRIEDNSSLQLLSGVQNLNGINLLVITGNSQLSFCEVQSVCDYLDVPDNLATITNNAQGCDSRQQVEEACNGLGEGCPDGNIILKSQEEVDAFLAEYPNCTMLPGDLKFRSGGGTPINDLSGFSNIVSVGGSLSFFQVDALTSMTGLNNITFVGENLSFFGNDGLTSMDGLTNLAIVNGNLVIRQNSGLIDLSGIVSLNTVGGFVGVVENDNLQAMLGIINLTNIGDKLLISGNPALTNLEGLNSLVNIGDRLTIFDNNALPNLNGLGNLASVGGSVVIFGNDVLENIFALSELTSINGNLAILENVSLTSLLGLNNLDTDGIEKLFIKNNTLLDQCAISTICVYLGIEANEASIANNGPSCSSRADIEADCAEGFNNGAALMSNRADADAAIRPADVKSTTLTVYPNPTHDRLQLRGAAVELAQLYSPQGQLVAQYNRPDTELDLSQLQAGVYYLRVLTLQGERQVVKVMIVD